MVTYFLLRTHEFESKIFISTIKHQLHLRTVTSRGNLSIINSYITVCGKIFLEQKIRLGFGTLLNVIEL